MIYVIAVVTAHSGKREEILEAFHRNTPAVRAESGCIEYRATIDAQDAPPMQTPYGDDTFVVVEKWADMEALRAHAASAHMASYAAATRPLIANRAIHVMSPLPAEE